jgi:hypothetical protein
LIAAGANPLEVAAQLGHRDARLVFQGYGHLYPGAAERAVQRLDAVTGNAAVGEAWVARRASRARITRKALHLRGGVPGSNR